MRPRSALLVVCALLAGGASAGCSRDASPATTAFADPVALTTFHQEDFAIQLKRMDSAVTTRHPFGGEQPLNAKYNGYFHISIGKDTSGQETETAIAGQPPGISTRYATDQEGNTLNYFHPAGKEYTYYLLGERYAGIAPTQWVRIPYEETDGGGWAPYSGAYCETIPLTYLCTIRGAIETTGESSRAKDATSHVTHTADGHTELRTQVTWGSLKDNGLSPLPISEDTLDELPSGIEDQLVPVRLWLDDVGFPIKGEINVAYGEGRDSFQLQVGFEYLGPASDADFVAPDNALDVTDMAASEFWTQVTKLDEEAAE